MTVCERTGLTVVWCDCIKGYMMFVNLVSEELMGFIVCRELVVVRDAAVRAALKLMCVGWVVDVVQESGAACVWDHRCEIVWRDGSLSAKLRLILRGHLVRRLISDGEFDIVFFTHCQSSEVKLCNCAVELAWRGLQCFDWKIFLKFVWIGNGWNTFITFMSISMVGVSVPWEESQARSPITLLTFLESKFFELSVILQMCTVPFVNSCGTESTMKCRRSVFLQTYNHELIAGDLFCTGGESLTWTLTGSLFYCEP